ncbi:MSP domain protein [Cooperia oncophora]
MSGRNDNPDKLQKSRDQVLSVDPEVASFTTAGGKSEHMLVNLGDKHLAVKVRCSNNQLYRVRPVYQVVETGQCKSLIVTRLIGPPRRDRLTIQYLPTTDINCNLIEFFKDAIRKGIKIEALRVILKMKEEDNFSKDRACI